MEVTTLTWEGKEYAVVPMEEYRRLTGERARPAKMVTKATGKRRGAKTPRRLSRQDRGDIAEAMRRLATEKSVPYETVRRKLGL